MHNMKHYKTPNVCVVNVEDADIVTLSIGENTFGLDFGNDFKTGVKNQQSGNINSVSFNNDFQ